MLERFVRPLSLERHKSCSAQSCGERSPWACFGDCLSKQATCIILLDYGTEVIDHLHVARCYPILCRILAFPLPSLKTCMSSILFEPDILPINLNLALSDSHIPPFKSLCLTLADLRASWMPKLYK